MEQISTSNTIISDMNDDCLLEVFQYLELIDLLAAADVSRRFRQIAQRQFALSEFKNDILEISCSSEYKTPQPFTYREIFLRPKLKTERKVRKYICKNSSFNCLVLYVSKFLRIFGASVKSIWLFRYLYIVEDNFNSPQHKYKNMILDLVSRYCSGTLTELQIYHCDLTGETEVIMRPLLARLQSLTINGCDYSKLFGQMLSLWSPELRELHLSYRPDCRISHEMELDGILRQSFPKLTMISFRSISGEKSYDIEEFLRINPQLTHFGMVDCSSMHGSIIQSIATHVPHIETIEIDRIFGLGNTHLKYCGRLNGLTTLKLCFYERFNEVRIDQQFMTSILYEIHVAKIALQHLHVLGISTQKFERTEQLVDAISKLKTLKTLWLMRVYTLKMSNIFRICEQLKELLDLKLLFNEIVISADDLLQMIKHAQKLRSLQYSEYDHFFENHRLSVRAKREREEIRNNSREYRRNRMAIVRQICGSNDYSMYYKVRHITKNSCEDAKRIAALHEAFINSLLPDEGAICIDAYPKMAQIVGQRREKARLLIELDQYSPIATKIPKHLIVKYDDVLTLVGKDIIDWRDTFFLRGGW